VPASVQGGLPPCTSTTRLSRSSLQQRGRARHAAHGLALSRCGSAYQAPPLYLFWKSVVFSQWRKRSTAIARQHHVSARWRIATSGQLARPGRCRQQRGHVPPSVAALGGNGTSPLYFVRCSVGYVSGHGGVPPCPGTTRLSRSVRGAVTRARCGTHCVALRVYIGCCFVKWPAVAALKLRLVPSTASRPHGFTKPTLCKVPPLGLVAQLSALPGRCPLSSALRAASWLPCGCGGAAALIRRFAQCSGQWPAASRVVCAPPTLWPRRCAALALRWSARPPPRGSLSPAQNTSRSFKEKCSRRFAPALLRHNAVHTTLMRKLATISGSLEKRQPNGNQ